MTQSSSLHVAWLAQLGRYIFDIRYPFRHLSLDRTAVDLTVPMEDYHECVRLVREYRQAHPLK